MKEFMQGKDGRLHHRTSIYSGVTKVFGQALTVPLPS